MSTQNLQRVLAASVLAVAVPCVAMADPTYIACGNSYNDSWFNEGGSISDSEDNTCSSYSGSGMTCSNPGSGDPDRIFRLNPGSVDQWMQINIDFGDDLRMGLYLSRGTACTNTFRCSSPRRGDYRWIQGWEADSNTNYYLSADEDDWYTDWPWAIDYHLRLASVGCCPDNDGDGTYAYNAACDQMPTNLRDCNDSDPVNAPNRSEVCDGRDNDCDGNIDEGLTFRNYYRDADGDGYGNPASSVRRCSQPTGYVQNNTDCDDTRGSAYPGNTEVCDGIDNNCNNQTDEGTLTTFYRDRDGDGFGDATTTTQTCSVPTGFTGNSTDCDDSTAARRPGNPEVCDNLDNDCNFIIDDGAGTAWYRDADQDGRGTPLNTVVACNSPTGFVGTSDDCDDNDRQRSPSLDEWCDGKDNNCNFIVDDGVGGLWYRDRDGDGRGDITTEEQACDNPGGRVTTNDDCDDTDPNRSPLLDEVCDGLDNDCDFAVDDNVGPVWFRDADNDGHGDSSQQRRACSEPVGYTNLSDDCDDSDVLRYPGNPEVCDDRDNDCNSLVDDNASDALTWYADSDGDQFGDPGRPERSCSQPANTVSNDDDCNDRTGAINPNATDVPYDNVDQDCQGGDLCDADFDGEPADLGLCGGNDCADGDATIRPGVPERLDGIDNNCDGQIDEDTSASDDDRDGWTEAAGDCDDADANVFPGARETCTGSDSDCDGEVDEDTLCSDDDGDGVPEDLGDCNDADPNIGLHRPEIPGNGIDDDCDGIVDAGSFDADGDGVTADAGDCDDNDPSAVPGAQEVADGVDNDCDGDVDEGTTAFDDDLDGLSEDEGDCDDNDPDVLPGATEVVNGRDDDCNGITDDQGEDWDDDGDGLSDAEGDCDDGDPDVRPGATEVANGIDDDCDGVVDDGVADLDQDGYRVEDGDCDDDDGWVYPGAIEMCDSVDNDCNGTVDEGCGDPDDTAIEPVNTTRCSCQTGPSPWVLVLVPLVLPFIRRRRAA